jgi:hypothetical protein
MTHLESVIMDADFWPEFDLFDLNLLLVFFGFMSFFVQLIKKFAVIHDSADRRICLRGDLDQIQIPVLRQGQSFLERQNADLLFVFIYYPDFSCLNPVIDPMRLFLSLPRMKSPSSDD